LGLNKEVGQTVKTILAFSSAIYLGCAALLLVLAYAGGSWTYHADHFTFLEIFLVSGFALGNVVLGTRYLRSKETNG